MVSISFSASLPEFMNFNNFSGLDHFSGKNLKFDLKKSGHPLSQWVFKPKESTLPGAWPMRLLSLEAQAAQAEATRVPGARESENVGFRLVAGASGFSTSPGMATYLLKTQNCSQLFGGNMGEICL